MIDIILSLALLLASGGNVESTSSTTVVEPETVQQEAPPAATDISDDDAMLSQMLDDLPSGDKPKQPEVSSDDATLTQMLDDLPSGDKPKQAEASGDDDTLTQMLDDLPNDDEPKQPKTLSGDDLLKQMLNALPSTETPVQPSIATDIQDEPELTTPKTLDRKLPMPLDQFKNIINLTKTSWIGFRDYNGKQLIYFTHLESWNCGISQVKYGFNGGALDQEWKLQACDFDAPNAVTTDTPYISLELNSVQSIDVQLTFDDGSQSGVERFNQP